MQNQPPETVQCKDASASVFRSGRITNVLVLAAPGLRSEHQLGRVLMAPAKQPGGKGTLGEVSRPLFTSQGKRLHARPCQATNANSTRCQNRDPVGPDPGTWAR